VKTGAVANVRGFVMAGAMAGAVCALVVASAFGARAQDDDASLLPYAPQRALVLANCRTCHSVQLIAQQRLTKEAWTGELVKMEKWGSALPPEQNAAVAVYLFRYFNPQVQSIPGKLVKSPKLPD